MIQRQLKSIIGDRLWQGKAIILFGARQVGKTTLLRELLSSRQDVLWLNGDEQDVRSLLEKASSTLLRAVIGKNSLVVIDEAQRITDIGIAIKLITDQIPGVQVLATGSSSFDLSNQINEPLTGRKLEYRMYPLSFGELVAHHGLLEEKRMLLHRLVYGSYPDVVTRVGDERVILTELADSYLYKDILTFDKIKKSERLVKLLQALAFQVGSEVSYNELAQTCGLDAKTVERYITLLEQSYIIFRLGSFSRNLRNELKFSRKIYFWDCGIRNAVLGNYQLSEHRLDIGALFENYMVSERLKKLSYDKSHAQSYFWRSKQKQEIDYIEEIDGQLSAVEFKWNPTKRASVPLSFARSYPDAAFQVLTSDHYEDFLL
ncbi:MAG: ATP-binding protein [Bacteroides sp.]